MAEQSSNLASKGAALAAVTSIAVATANLAFAYPDGAPWGSSIPTAGETCASCHYDYDAVMESGALEIDGWPESFIAGKRYLLTARFKPSEASIAGFQVTAMTDGEGEDDGGGGGEDAGVFACSAGGVEIAASGVRSVVPRRKEDGLSWRFAWLAPTNATGIVLYVAASAANDDGSPFGDVIHYRAFRSQPDRKALQSKLKNVGQE